MKLSAISPKNSHVAANIESGMADGRNNYLLPLKRKSAFNLGVGGSDYPFSSFFVLEI